MLISLEVIKNIIAKYNIKVSGVLHIGAHECEESTAYDSLGIEDVIWIDAIESKVKEALQRGKKCFQAVITDKDDDEVEFNVSNNIQSSSVLQLHTHKSEHPNIFYTYTFVAKTITIDTFLQSQNDASKYNFWNFDIQGAELLALKGAHDSLKHASILYLEVNEKELYKNCALINEIDDFLRQHKFIRVETKMTSHGWGDAIYVKEQ